MAQVVALSNPVQQAAEGVGSAVAAEVAAWWLLWCCHLLAVDLDWAQTRSRRMSRCVMLIFRAASCLQGVWLNR
jgi:hypothetical protein